MKKSNRSIASTFVCLVALTLVMACGKKDKGGMTAANEGVDTDATVASSVLGTVGSSAQEGESSATALTAAVAASYETPASTDDVSDDQAFPPTATITTAAVPTVAATPRCKASDSRQACAGDTLKSNFGKCASATGQSWLEGQWSQQYTPAAACESHRATNQLTDGGRMLKTTSKFVVHGLETDLTISSNARTTKVGNFGGGIGISRATEDSQSVTTVSVQGISKTVSGKNVGVRSDLTLHSVGSVIKIAGSKANRSRVANGYINVENNIRKVSQLVSLINVKWQDPKCCYPSSGTARVDTIDPVSQKPSSTSYLNFNSTGCGTATFVIASGKKQNVSLNLCEE